MKIHKGKVCEVLKIAIPSMIESFSGAVVGTIDSFMVSSLGSSAVAAVGITTMPKFFCMVLFLAINVAVSVLVARRTGEQNRDKACKIAITALTLTGALSLVAGVIIAALSSEIMLLCGSNPEIHTDASEYFAIIMGFMIFNCLSMSINAILRGVGNTKITMYSSFASNGVNVVFNFLLIGGNFGFPALGVKGAAIATVLGTVISTMVGIYAMSGKGVFISIHYVIEKKIKPSVTCLLDMIKIGYSVLAEQFLLRGGMMLVGIMTAMQGTYALAANQVAYDSWGLVNSLCDGVRTAAVTLVGKSLGERREDKAVLYGKICHIIVLVMVLVFGTLYFFSAERIVRIFFDEPEVLYIGKRVMYLMIPTLFFGGQQLVVMGILHGAGDTRTTAIIASCCTILIRAGIGYVLNCIFGFGIYGLWIAIMLDQMMVLVCSYVRFKSEKWKKIKI